MIDNPGLNAGMFKKCAEARNRGIATNFEALCIQHMSLAAGLTKRKHYQAALRTLTEERCPLEIVQPLLLEFAHAQSKGKPQSGAAASSSASASSKAVAVAAKP